MLEYCIYCSSNYIDEMNIGKVIEQYKERSILEDEEIEVFNLFDNKAVLIMRQRYRYQGNYIYNNEGNITCFTGYICSNEFNKNSSTICAQLHSKLINNDDTKWLDNCLGEFQIINYTKKLLQVILSPSMTHPLYYREADSEIVISNRSSLTQLSLYKKNIKIDIQSQLEIIAFDSILENNTAFLDTKCLERGYNISVNYKYSTPKLELIKRKDFWSTNYTAPPLEDALDQINSLYEWFVNHLNLLQYQLNIDDKMSFHLSGGKDSRLLLSLFQKSGLIKYFNSILTYGETSSDPEVRAAKLVTDHYKLKHEVKSRGVSNNVFFEKLPQHIYQLEGEINCRILLGNYKNKGKTHFTGHELLRESFRNTEHLRNTRDVNSFILEKLPLDPIRVVNQNAYVEMKEKVFNIFDESIIRWNIKPENFFNYFFIIGRGSRWLGKITSMSSPSGLYSNIFAATPIVKYAHNIGVQNRNREIIHFGMLMNADSNILKYPFAKQKWHADIISKYKDIYNIPDYAIEGNGYNIRIENWWDTIYSMDKNQYIKRVIESLRHKDLDFYIDYDMLYYYIDVAKNPSMRAMLSIYAIISSNLLLHAGDITLNSIKEMENILSDVKKDAEKNCFKLYMQKDSLHKFTIPLKNTIYRKIFNANSVGSNKVNIKTIRYDDELIEGIFIHSGNKLNIDFNDGKRYSIMFRCMVLKDVADKCEDQIFSIISQKNKEVFRYTSRKNARDNENIAQYKVDFSSSIVLSVHSDVSSSYGWCMFVIDEITVKNDD